MFFYRMFMKVIRIDKWLLIWSSIMLVMFSSILIVKLEPETFPTFFEGLWWVMTTVTTVGYGDYSPVTESGRLFAIFLYIFGIGLIGVLIGKIVEWLTEIRSKREEGKVVFKGKGHIVIIGWSQKAAYAIEEILESDSSSDVVIVDTLEKAPMLTERVYYIQGDPTSEIVLRKANIDAAKGVLIFADDHIQDLLLADGKSLITATSVESIAPHVHTTVEIMSDKHVKNFKHVNVNEFILSNDTISRMAVRSMFEAGVSEVYAQLISRKQGDDLYQIHKKPEWKTYREAFEALLNEGATLISDRGNLSINRTLQEQIPEDARLYVICNNDTYKKLSAKA